MNKVELGTPEVNDLSQFLNDWTKKPTFQKHAIHFCFFQVLQR